MRIILGSAVEQEEPGAPAFAAIGRGGELGGEADDGRGGHADRTFAVLADDQQIISSLAAEEGGGRFFDGHWITEPGLSRARRFGPARQLELLAKQGVARHIGRGVALEDDRRARRDRLAFLAHRADLLQIVFPRLVGEPDDLEEMVSLGRAVGVVVNRLARSREPLGGQVVLGQDQEGIDFAALQGDPHGHLAQGAAGQCECPAERLRSELNVNAEGSALADQAVEQKCGLLGDLVFLDEEFLEFVDHQQNPGQGGRAGSIAITAQVLHAGIAKLVGSEPHFQVEPLEHADAELALAFDRHHAGVGQLEAGVNLELDAFLEVDQVKVDLVGAVAKRQVGDQSVHQRRLARPGSPGYEHVLRGALTQGQVLPLGGAGFAQGNVDPGAAVLGPPRFPRRGDELEGDLDSLGRPGRPRRPSGFAAWRTRQEAADPASAETRPRSGSSQARVPSLPRQVAQ